MNPAQRILIAAGQLYRTAISPAFTVVFGPLGFGCRFHPTCSQYALEAVQRHGAVKGSLLAMRRLCQCHPWGRSGLDPVPEHFPILRLHARTPAQGSSLTRGNASSAGDTA